MCYNIEDVYGNWGERMTLLLPVLSETTGLLDILRQLFTPLIDFFIRYGEIGLFLYSIIETITPMAGVEFILVPLIVGSPERWWLLTSNLVIANTIGAIIVFLFLAKEDSKMYNRFVSKKQQQQAKKMFDRYGFWAIFIFAMTPLPFFVIIFTAAIAKMKFRPYIIAAFLSRSTRFFITSYFVYNAAKAGERVETGPIIFWLAVIGVSIALLMMFLQRMMLKYFEKKAE